jgi:crotonobetainyl-CoA:carnitine CoA-transferase CaiB-like acyl-CoA transferase
MTARLAALSGLRVIEHAEGLAGPFAGKLLAELGAEVIKVEPAGGDRTRQLGPFPGGRADPDRSGMFHYLNAGKQSVVIEAASAQGPAQLDRLAAAADVLIVAGTAAEVASHPLTGSDARRRHPGLVCTTITPFGMTGPLADAPAHDITICSLGAITNAVGEPGREPLTPPLSLSSYQAGIAAAAGSLLALFERTRSGLGQHVDISPLDVWGTVHQGSILANYVNFGHLTPRAGRRRHEAYPFHLMRARDGWMCLIARDGQQWARFAELVVGDQRLDDPRYRDRAAMGLRYPEEVDRLLQPWFDQRTRREVFDLCRKHRVPFAPVRRIDEVAACEQLSFRKFFVDLAHDDTGSIVRVPGSPHAMSATPAVHRRAPRLGEHDAVLLTASPGSAHQARAPAGQARAPAARGPLPPPGFQAGRQLPLTGVRVLDLSWVLAGPAVGRFLADAGADVIKVESRSRPDNTRRARSLPAGDGQAGPAADPLNRVPMFHSLNAGKRSVQIDLRSAAGIGTLKRLARHCDVVIENYAPGVMRRLGIDYPVLSRERPDLVMLSMSGAGQQGPLSDVPAYAPTVTALAGLDSVTGYDGEEPQGVLGLNFADSTGALFGFHAVLAALWARQRERIGQHIDFSEMEGVIAMTAQPFIEFAMTGTVMAPAGNCQPGAMPYGVFGTAATGRWMSIAVTSDAQWRRFCAATPGQPWAGDPRYETAAGRLAAAPELGAAVAAYTRTRDADELVAGLRAAGVAAARVYAVADQVADEHFWARDIFRTIDVAGIGPLLVTGAPWRLADTPVLPRRGAPGLGQDTDEVLASVLGLTGEDIGALRESGALS